MTRLEYLRAVIVEADAHLDYAIEELADVKAWLAVHEAKSDLGPFHVYMNQATEQHRRVSRVMDLMDLVRRRTTYTAAQAIKELKRTPGIAGEVTQMATQLRRLAERSARVCEFASVLFDKDFISFTRHLIALSKSRHPLALPAPVKE